MDQKQYSTALIAGEHAGARVRANAATHRIFQQMQRLAQDGHYWAHISVSAIQSLASGHHKPSVFVEERAATAKRLMFDMILPGCRASVIKRSNGEYLLYRLVADLNFQASQMRGEQPGLFRVDKRDEEWLVKSVPDGKVLPKGDRTVAVSDRHPKVQTAAADVAQYAIGAPISGGSTFVGRHGFDMHFTPGPTRIGGMRSITQARNPAADPAIRESAALLAHTMQQAGSIQGIRWVTERGGSGVLTQAMQILRDQGISLEGSKHLVFFNQPTTCVVTAERLARGLGLEFDRKTRSSNYLSPDQLIGGLGFGGGYIAAWNRFRADPEHTALRLGADIYLEATAGKGALGATGTVAGAIAGAVGFTVSGGGSAYSMPAVITFAAAVGGAVGNLGPKLVEAWLPHRYNRIKAKL